MWFKNLTLFRLIEPFTVTAEVLEERLSQSVFQPCSSQEFSRHGWVPPLGRRTTALVHAANGCLLVCLKTAEKVLPPAVIRESVAEQVATLEEREQRTVRRPEQERIRDEVLQTLLPKALIRSQHNYAYIDPRNAWLVIDSANRRVIERITGLLRRTLGSLPIKPPQVTNAPPVVMTDWLARDNLAADFGLQDECELRDADEEGGVVRCKGQDLSGSEILNHLQAGKQVTRLALTWNGRMAFVLTEDLSIRRLHFLDIVKEQVEAAETVEQVFDAQFALMTGELTVFLPRLLEAFGGERAH